jgi:hypothetical protein
MNPSGSVSFACRSLPAAVRLDVRLRAMRFGWTVQGDIVRMTARLTGVAVALAALASPVLAADGVLIVERATRGDNTRTGQMQIEPQRIRAEITDPQGRVQVVIFDGAKQVMWVVDPANKTYREMTKADVDRLGGQVNAALAKLQEQVKNLPPAQRAQVEAAIKARTTAAKTEYRRTGTDKVGRWTCTKYDGYDNGQKTSELCTVEPKDLGFAPADFAVTRQLSEFFRSLMPQNADVFAIGNPDDQGFSGIPVRRVVGIAPNQTINETAEIRRETFPDSLFAVPAGFKREPLPQIAPQ